MSNIEHNANVKAVGWLEKHLNMGVIVYLLISTVTLGIYPLFFCFKFTRLLSEMVEDTGKDGSYLRRELWISLIGAICYLIGIVLSGYSAIFALVALIGLLAGVIMGIKWAFSCRAAMISYYAQVHGFPMAINGFLLFFFSNIMLLIAANSAERTKQLHETVR